MLLQLSLLSSSSKTIIREMIKIGSLIDLSPLPKAPSFQWLTCFLSNTANLSSPTWPAHLPFVHFLPEAQKAGERGGLPLRLQWWWWSCLSTELSSLCLAQQSLPIPTSQGPDWEELSLKQQTRVPQGEHGTRSPKPPGSPVLPAASSQTVASEHHGE